MPVPTKAQGGPAGTAVSAHLARKLDDPEFRNEWERLRPFEELARIVVQRRRQLGYTQTQLAEAMGTTASAISRIESGQHETRPGTLRKLAVALGGHAVIGFTFDDQPEVVTASGALVTF
jgi:ribosome-binding protein aMBF1 (putative translation factor)